MKTSKAVLIVGGSGTIGTQLALALRHSHRVYLTYQSRPIRMDGVTSIPISLSDKTWCKRILYAFHPEVIIYCAGSNDPGFVAENERISELAHASGPASLLSSSDFGAPKFIYLSSAYVFDGGKGNYRESDVVLPASTLGKYKVGGENYIRGKSVNYLIVRSSPVIVQGNGYSQSFFDRLLRALNRNERITLPSNDLYSFTHICTLVDLVAKLVDAGIRNKIFHCSGLTRTSYFDFARLFALRFGFDPSCLVSSGNVLPGASGGYQGGKSAISSGGPLTLDFSLNCSQAVETLKLKPLLLEECFDLIEKDLVGGPARAS